VKLRVLSSVFALLCLWLSAGLAHGASVTIVLTEKSAGYLDVSKSIAADLERAGLAPADITQLSAMEWTASEASRVPSKVIITLGSEALKQVLSADSRVPVVAALVPLLGYERIVRDSHRKVPRALTAVYLDQPFARRIDLLRLVLPDAKRVGVLWGPESMLSQSNLGTAMQARGLAMESAQVATSSGLFAGLSTVLDGTDALFAVADPQVYSSSTIANVLLATYRAGIPVFAFSPAYVKAGALIALYATPGQIGVQAAALARSALQGGTLPAPQYPVEFEISVNEHVARSLGLNLDAKSLSEKLSSGGRRP
jgi:putative ABC transport system substrate-binding protein